MAAQKDIWDRIELGLRAKGLENFQVRKVKGHAKDKGEEEGEEERYERIWNDAADKLANSCAVNLIDAEGKRIRIEADKKRSLVGRIQKMMIDIFLKRIEAQRNRGQRGGGTHYRQ